MSQQIIALPMGNSPVRAQAKESLWRLFALVVSYPTPESHAALTDGRFHEAFDHAWQQVHGRRWLSQDALADYANFEANYIHTFMHGFKGRPVASILAGEYDAILAGLSRPVFMLNLVAFYKHFGLQPATGDEGRQDEPDHLAVMAEFMAVLCHLEARALSERRDPSSPRRAQRDFLARYMIPFLDAVNQRLKRDHGPSLDPCVNQVLADTSTWASRLLKELEASVGVFRNPGMPDITTTNTSPSPELAVQNLWG